jgi:hypothetical protein
MKYTFRAYKDNEMVCRVRTGKIKRIYHFIQRAKKLGSSKYYIRVYYGKHIDCWGKHAPLINEDEYDNTKELLHALKAFTERND